MGRPSEGLLQYYERQGISPVRYDLDDIEAHFDRRDSLYRALGLPPAAFCGARVLEVAAGSGQNSLYIASCRPASYDLVEPNLTGIRDIRAAYEGLRIPHAKPQLHTVQFEKFEARAAYDVVLCENWLGSVPGEIAMIRKLASLVAPGGVLALTFVPHCGFFPNIMRKLLTLRILDQSLSFEEQTKQLEAVFSPHLSSIAHMTRGHRDWVQDTMLNPHYLTIALAPETVIEATGGDMEALATFPRFTPDWRWFKELTGAKRCFNAHLLNAYRENLHNFSDYRRVFPPRAASANLRLDASIQAIHQVALAWPAGARVADDCNAPALVERVDEQLSVVCTEFAQISEGLGAAVDELRSVWQYKRMDASMVRDMRDFATLFGRETVYVSFTRRRRAATPQDNE
jgi:2-polyprenyl-3-methyl-5-hydroxy-6-metoxy-1,4-benzoquinol methylase